ncbi:hypothetical protein [Pleionea sp. CnH1-48]|uniref:hypothetical protein n=1 Tax=Pleionea sp. CnH1-48 TaxID=2954494 RepID=UPI002096B4C2|nr:hypothetical protein [Pleionea sp. CnH1-48]MCO7226086.1 hypothetical protein [Pleionea sp. CnH1-48]
MKLLWIDDDWRFNRFRYEQDRISDTGWEVDFAISICEAVDKLNSQSYQALFLDQQFPYDDDSHIDSRQELDIWAGNIIYAWLFSSDSDLENAGASVRGCLERLKNEYPPPHEDNKRLPVLILSSYEKNKNYSSGRGKPVVNHYAKPLDVDDLLLFLSGVEREFD